MNQNTASSWPTKRAFTLIELLVVIAIIAILAAILFPVFAQAKAAAKTAASTSNVKQNALAVQMYAGDYDDYAFLPWQDGAWAHSDGGGAYALQKLYPYIKNIDIVWDAASSIPNYVGGRPMTSSGYWGDWTLGGTLGWSNGGLVSSDGWNPKNFSSIEQTSQLMVMAPCTWGDSPDTGCFAFAKTDPSCYNSNDAVWSEVGLAAKKWHSNGVLAAFVDGHAKLTKGMVYIAPNNDCYDQLFSWWSTNSSKGDYTPSNPWSTWFLQERVLNFWGAWWKD